MSRRCHHGSPRHARPIRPGRPPLPRPHVADAGTLAEPGPEQEVASAAPIEAVETAEPLEMPEPSEAAARPAMSAGDPEPRRAAMPARPPIPHERPAERPATGEPPPDSPSGVERVATAPQLRRFIKSRAYVPMHELRRRFAINGGDDDVTPVDVDRSRVYVGLPEREGRLLGELLRGGDIGYELSLDPVTPVVVGVYPMRPVSRG